MRPTNPNSWVGHSDGRATGIPYAWFPRLLNASLKQREAVEIGRVGLHWEDIDEDISIAGLLAGRRDQTVQVPRIITGTNGRVRPVTTRGRQRGNFTMVRNGACLKCDTCGATRGAAENGAFLRGQESLWPGLTRPSTR